MGDSLTYDNVGRLVGTTTQYTFLPNNTYSNSYSYDAASNRIGFTAPDGSTNSYSYDSLNRLSSLTNSLTERKNGAKMAKMGTAKMGTA